MVPHFAASRRMKFFVSVMTYTWSTQWSSHTHRTKCFRVQSSHCQNQQCSYYLQRILPDFSAPRHPHFLPFSYLLVLVLRLVRYTFSSCIVGSSRVQFYFFLKNWFEFRSRVFVHVDLFDLSPEIIEHSDPASERLAISRWLCDGPSPAAVLPASSRHNSIDAYSASQLILNHAWNGASAWWADKTARSTEG